MTPFYGKEYLLFEIYAYMLVKLQFEQVNQVLKTVLTASLKIK
jgi:hypothetical protein